MNRLIRLPVVLSITGWSRSSLYAAIKRGEFPRQIPIGTRAVAWLEQDVQDWLTRKVEQSSNTASEGGGV